MIVTRKVLYDLHDVYSSNLTPFILHPPKEMPCSEDWLTQCLSRIESNEMHISPYLQEVFLCHSLLCKIPILGGVLSKSCHHSVSLPATTFLAFHPSELSSSPLIIPKPHAAHTSPPQQTSTSQDTSTLAAMPSDSSLFTSVFHKINGQAPLHRYKP